jgi:hypothetical protein
MMPVTVEFDSYQNGDYTVLNSSGYIKKPPGHGGLWVDIFHTLCHSMLLYRFWFFHVKQNKLCHEHKIESWYFR